MMSHSGHLARVDSGDLSLLARDGGVTFIGIEGENSSVSQQQVSREPEPTLPPAPERRFESLRSNHSPRHASLLKLSLISSPAKVKDQKQYLNDYTENESHWKNNGSKLSEPWAVPEICREDTIILTGGDATKINPYAPLHNTPAPTHMLIPSHKEAMGPLQKSILAARRNRWHTSGIICINEPKKSDLHEHDAANKATVVNRLKNMIDAIEDSLLKKTQTKSASRSGLGRSQQERRIVESSNNRGLRASKRYVACPGDVVITPQPTNFVRAPYRYDADPTHNAGNNVVYCSIGDRKKTTAKSINAGGEESAACYVPVKSRFDYKSRKVPILKEKKNAKAIPNVPSSEPTDSALQGESFPHAIQTYFQMKKNQLFGDKGSHDNIPSSFSAASLPQKSKPLSAPKYVSHPENKPILEQPVLEISGAGNQTQKEPDNFRGDTNIPIIPDEMCLVTAPTLAEKNSPEPIGRDGHIVAIEEEPDAAINNNDTMQKINSVPPIFATEPILVKSLMGRAKQGFGARVDLPKKRDEAAPSARHLDAFRFPSGEENKALPASENHVHYLEEMRPTRINENKQSFRDQRRNGIVGTEALAEAFRTNL